MLQDIKVRSAPTLFSPTLMNMTLDGLEKLLREKYPSNTRRSRKAKVNMVRYADDMIITGSSPELLADEIKPLVEKFLRERGLELEKVRRIIKTNKPASAGELIVKLNPIIKGWANYHRHVVSKRVFSQVDRAIFESLWQWARRRHAAKGKQWVAKKYFLHPRTGQWVFFGQVRGKDGAIQTVRLTKASGMPIQRHIKIRGEANPYDPQWEEYFEQRLGVEMVNLLKGKQRLLKLWKQQKGECLVCDQPITKTTGWHIHHLVPRTKGGGDQVGNLVLLHPTCHNQVHSTGLEVVKPRPAKGVS